jgi:hypothetical protein
VKRAAAWRCAGRALLLGLAVVAVVTSPARAQSRDERAVRAAYLYNLIKYVGWPAQGKDLTVAFAGDAPTSDVIGQLLNGRASDGQTIRVVQPASSEELERCSVLYVSGASESDIRKILEKVKGRSVLTVGENDAFAQAGGMVALVNTGDHIRIEVNLEAAQSVGIRISSRVLGLATIVRSAGKGGN